ncbi:MAG: transcriptional activator NhaR [Myxococcales bacterium]|nr:transcriptional activator NhaR [Myxococcales bacterium]
MDYPNFQHLLYFWTVAREGALVRGAKKLRLSPSTVSAQIHALEESLDAKLFERVGRGLRMTDMGRMVFRYAEEIFLLGRELVDTARGRPVDRPLNLHVGVADVVPKLVARKLLEPAMSLPDEIQMICHDGKPGQLLADLAMHHLDVVIVDAPIGPGVNIKAFNHLLGECDVEIFGTQRLFDRYRKGFPRSLDGAPFLLPLDSTAIRRSIDAWFERNEVRPHVVGEFDDAGLMKVFGLNGAGLFPAPVVVKREVQRQYQVKSLGSIEGVRDRFYAITVGRRLKHPAVVAISKAAQDKIFT